VIIKNKLDSPSLGFFLFLFSHGRIKVKKTYHQSKHIFYFILFYYLLLLLLYYIGLIMFFIPQVLCDFVFSPPTNVCSNLVPHVLKRLEIVLLFGRR